MLLTDPGPKTLDPIFCTSAPDNAPTSTSESSAAAAGPDLEAEELTPDMRGQVVILVSMVVVPVVVADM